MGITGTLVEKDGCLLLEAPIGNVYLTPIFPSGVSYWNKKQNIRTLYSPRILVLEAIFQFGVALSYYKPEINGNTTPNYNLYILSTQHTPTTES